MKLYGKAQQVATEILEAFEAGAVPAALASTLVDLPPTDSPMRRWSTRNRFIATLQGHRDARGFRQWKEVGRTVKRGARAFYILGPCTVIAKQDDPDRGIEEGDTILTGFRALPVFGLSQTEGEPLPWIEEERRFFDTRPLVEVARSWDLDLRVDPPEARRGGSYEHDANGGIAITVAIDSLNTWAHELVHAADHRLGTLTRAHGQRLDNELVAELGAATLLECLGYTHESDRGRSYHSIQQYALEHDCVLWSICSQLLDRTCACVAHLLEEAAQLSAEA